MSNEVEIPGRSGCCLAGLVVAAILVAIVIGFMITGTPVPGQMAHASVEDLEKLHDRRPHDDEVTFYYAGALMHDGDTPHAYELMKGLVSHNPRSVRYMARLAQFSAMRGRAIETVDLYQRIVALDPSAAEAHSELGHILTEAGLLTDGLHEYDAAIRINPKVGYDPSLYARCLNHAGRAEEAWKQLTDFFNQIPRQDRPYEDLTEAGIKLGRFSDTEALLVRRIRMDRIYPVCRFYYCLAQVALAKPRSPASLKDAGIWAEAATHDNRATKEQHPIEARYFGLLARVREDQGRLTDARTAAEAGLKIDRANKESLAEMVHICQRTRDPKTAEWQQAYWKAAGESAEIEALTRASKSKPGDSRASLALAGALVDKGRFGEAEDICFRIPATDANQLSAEDTIARCRAGALHRMEVKAKQENGNL